MYYDTNTGQIEGNGGLLADGSPRDFRAFVQYSPQYAQYLDYVGNDSDFQSGGGINEAALREYSAGATGSGADDEANYQANRNNILGAWNTWSGRNGSTGVLGTSTGGSSNYSQEDIDYLNSQKSLYERLLESIGTAESGGLQKLQDSETMARNKANESRSRQLEGFGMQREDLTKGKDTSLQAVGDNSRMLRNSLMQRLGLGSGGGSAFLQADNAVARDASKNRLNVMNTYGTNDRNLSYSERNADEDYRSLLDEILADRRAKEESFKAGIYGQRQGIQESLGQIESERARLLGGNQLNASAPYRTNYMNLQSQIDQLPNQYRTDVQARELKVQTPSLKDYVVDRAKIGGGQTQQQYSPYSQFLRPKDDEEQIR